MDAVAAAEHEVADHSRDLFRVRRLQLIAQMHRPVWHAQPHGGGAAKVGRGGRAVAARPGIARAVVAGMRCAGDLGDLAPRTIARKGVTAGAQIGDRRVIAR